MPVSREENQIKQEKKSIHISIDRKTSVHNIDKYQN